MRVFLQLGKRLKTEYGNQVLEKMEEIGSCKMKTKVPFTKHIHPSNKDKNPCYKGKYYKI